MKLLIAHLRSAVTSSLLQIKNIACK
jgi:hypothetical protein